MTEVSFENMEMVCLHILSIAFPLLAFKRKFWKILGSSTQSLGFARTAQAESGSIKHFSMKSIQNLN